MAETSFIIWLFPVLFIFHDFEEIIFLKPWITRNHERLCVKFPKASKLLSHSLALSTSSLALGVLEEYVLVSGVTILAHLAGWYFLWFGAFVAFTAHLIGHCVQSALVRGYVPAIVTSVVCLPVCCRCIAIFLTLYQPDIAQIALASFVGIALMLANLQAIHKGMRVFDRWLREYQDKRS